MSSTVCLVIPMFNEATTIGIVVSNAIKNGYTCVCIDDASNDHSAINARDEGAIVIRHALNLGQGAALGTGFRFVKDFLPKVKYVFTFDADDQHSIDDVATAVKEFESNNQIDVILGSRFLKSGFQGTLLKRVILQGMARFSFLTMGLRITDRHNGFRGIKIDSLDFFRISNPGFGHADEILRLIKKNNLLYTEVQTNIKYTAYSNAKGQRLINGFRLVFDRFLGAK
ncbi:MAG: glycosyltransferase family 2 protein [Proteobacteria bacterium]|nr:glycosyltransferase family 2 protein [Pseudomonadota bacterium]